MTVALIPFILPLLSLLQTPAGETQPVCTELMVSSELVVVCGYGHCPYRCTVLEVVHCSDGAYKCIVCMLGAISKGGQVCIYAYTCTGVKLYALTDTDNVTISYMDRLWNILLAIYMPVVNLQARWMPHVVAKAL